GGVDSSAVVAAMAAEGEAVSTYTVGFAPEDLEHEIVPDDLRWARRVGKLFGTDYHEETLRPDVLELLPKVIWHLEEPVADPAAISTYLNAKTFLPCLNLTDTDKMGMAASVEVRVPLLDDELVSHAARIPSNLKLRGFRRKYVFKRSQERTLPKDVVWRRKAGFGAPV